MKSISAFTLLVKDYDEAIAYYTKILGFVLVEDTKIDDKKRWVMIAPSKCSTTKILLARAANNDQEKFVGNQSGGRVLLFLETNDFDEDYANFKKRGVDFQEAPRHEEYGTVVVFKDIYGNKWDLIQMCHKGYGEL